MEKDKALVGLVAHLMNSGLDNAEIAMMLTEQHENGLGYVPSMADMVGALRHVLEQRTEGNEA